jgi:hypothetical protein
MGTAQGFKELLLTWHQVNILSPQFHTEQHRNNYVFN